MFQNFKNKLKRAFQPLKKLEEKMEIQYDQFKVCKFGIECKNAQECDNYHPSDQGYCEALQKQKMMVKKLCKFCSSCKQVPYCYFTHPGEKLPILCNQKEVCNSEKCIFSHCEEEKFEAEMQFINKRMELQNSLDDKNHKEIKNEDKQKFQVTKKINKWKQTLLVKIGKKPNQTQSLIIQRTNKTSTSKPFQKFQLQKK